MFKVIIGNNVGSCFLNYSTNKKVYTTVYTFSIEVEMAGVEPASNMYPLISVQEYSDLLFR